MKYIYATILLLGFLSCKAQNPVYALNDFSGIDTPSGSYFKDIDHDLDKYVGTWKYTTSTIVFIITIEKKIMYLNSLGDYYDLLIGEYKYEAFGTEIINTMPLLANPPAKMGYHNLYGYNLIRSGVQPECTDCTDDELRIVLSFSDPEREYIQSNIILRPTSNPFQGEMLKAEIVSDGGWNVPFEDSPSDMRVPFGSYTFKKVQ